MRYDLENVIVLTVVWLDLLVIQAFLCVSETIFDKIFSLMAGVAFQVDEVVYLFN